MGKGDNLLGYYYLDLSFSSLVPNEEMPRKNCHYAIILSAHAQKYVLLVVNQPVC